MLTEQELQEYEDQDDIQRVDPDDCGCTDCMTGYSLPFNEISKKQLINLIRGKYQDATGYDKKVIAEEARDRGLVEAE